MKTKWKRILILFIALLSVIFMARITNARQFTLDDWIDRLVQVESGGREYIKILDSNNKYSYSCLQFQEETFKEQIKKFNLLPYAEENEYMNFVYDCKFQRSLAKKMIENNYSEWKRWTTSVKKIGLPPK